MTHFEHYFCSYLCARTYTCSDWRLRITLPFQLWSGPLINVMVDLLDLIDSNAKKVHRHRRCFHLNDALCSTTFQLRSCSCPRQTAACYYAPDLLFSRLSIAALRQRPYFKTHSCNLVWSNHSPCTAIFVSFMAAAIWTTVHSMLILCTSTHFNFQPARGSAVREPKPSVQTVHFSVLFALFPEF